MGYEGAMVSGGLGEGGEEVIVDTLLKYPSSVKGGEFLGYLSD
jgi:hypothetical protein